GKLEINTKDCNRPGCTPPLRQHLNQLKVSGFTLIETLHAPGSRIPDHVHHAASVCLTLSGKGLEIVEGVRVVEQPGGVLMRAAGIKHSNQYGAVPLRGLMIEIDNRWLQTWRSFLRVFEGHRYFPRGPVPALALRVYRESRVKDTIAPVIVEGLMLEMLGLASRSLIKTPVRPPYWLTQARDLLHGRFNDSLNLLEVANAVGVHPTHLARTFKKHYRTTVGEYLRALRLDWATRQLSETETSIAEVAAAAGFYDQSHFSHLFKQHTGFSPAEFRAFSNGAG